MTDLAARLRLLLRRRACHDTDATCRADPTVRRAAEIVPNVGGVPYGSAVETVLASGGSPQTPRHVPSSDEAAETRETRGPALSPSRAADFMTCPLLYRFRVVDRLPEPPTTATARGTLVHAALERLFDRPAPGRTPEAARELLAAEWDRLAAAEPDLATLFENEAERADWLASATAILNTYFTLEDPRTLEPAARESYVETTLDNGLRLRGYIDRLDVAPGGEIRIVDYKTGRAPREAYEASALFQMKFYALVIWRLRDRVPMLLQLMYLAEGEVLRYQPDESDLRATERKIRALWQAIERARATGDWRPRPSRLCDWCNHKALCPEFGGTPPPLPETTAPSGEAALPASPFVSPVGSAVGPGEVAGGPGHEPRSVRKKLILDLSPPKTRYYLICKRGGGGWSWTEAGGMAIIEARGLARTFRSRRRTVEAVRGVDLTVEGGEIVGFLGPNGAGKTTTLRMLTTLLHPTAGTATVAGADLLADPVGVRRRIGYVPQAIGQTMGGTDPSCLVIEELLDQAALYHLPAAQGARRAEALIGQLELSGLERRLVKTLSGGQRRRLEIALGLVHSPALVFLDEPSTGLDPQSRSNLWEHIGALRSELGTTVFLTTHYLEEADVLCDRVFVIDNGVIAAAGTPDELKRRISGDVVTLRVAEPTGRDGTARKLLADQPVVREISATDGTLRLTVERGEQALPSLLRVLDAAGITLKSINLSRPTLDDVFLTLTGRSLRDDSPAPTAEGRERAS
jgi:ABC-2 type transport system ATP-binding protein